MTAANAARRVPPLDQVAIVLLATVAGALVLVGAGRAGSTSMLAAGSLVGACALMLVARRSMEHFVLVVLVLRTSLDGLHVHGRAAATDPATVLGALFVVVGLLWLAARRAEGRRHPMSAPGVALVSFLLAVGLATLGSEAPLHSLGEAARLGTAVLMFFVVDRLCEDTGRPDRVVVAILGAAVVPVTVALLGPLVGLHRTEVKDGIERAISTLAQSNPFGHFLTMVVLILGAYALVRRGRQRQLAVVAAAPVTLALALTYTRLAWVAAVVGLLVMVWVLGRRWLVPIIVIVLLVFAAATPQVGHRLDQLTTSNAAVPGSESGADWRLGQWADVARLGRDNPVTGIGPDVVALRLSNHQPPHNDYLRAFVELGLVGLVAYLGVLGTFIGVAVRAQRRAVGARARTDRAGGGRGDQRLCGVVGGRQPARSGSAALVRPRARRERRLGGPARARRRGPARRRQPHRRGAPRDGGRIVTERAPILGWLSTLAVRARPFWPIGVVVAVVTALVGLAVAWEAPYVFRTRATVFVPGSVSSQGAGQRYISDMEAAINSAAVKGDVARDLGVPPSALGSPVAVRQIGQSTVMQVALETPRRLTNPGDAVSRLVARAGQSLAAPEVNAAKAQLARAAAGLTDAESAAVTAKKARDEFLADRGGVTPDDELAIVGPQLAQLRVCAIGAIVPPGGSSTACRQQAAKLEPRATALAQASDQLAALDRDRDQAESEVQDAQQDRRSAEAAVTAASVAPVDEVIEAGHRVSRLPGLARRIVAILGGSLLLGLAVVVALALLVRPAEEPTADDGARDRPGVQAGAP